MSERLKIRPYARLLTMLGDQLIKNELIALVELIKNSYDADASWVKVSFIDFGPDYELTPTSKIRIEDDGCGMNADILRKHWLNPATPDKLKRKAKNPKTQKGRILQGEKGIGRFAIFKLGKKITITTRRQQQNSEGKFIESGENIENIVEASNPVPTPLLGHRCRSSQEITGSPTPFSTSNHYLWICASASFSLSNPNIAA